MIRHLSYMFSNKSSDLPQQIKADKIITEDEFNLICECSQVIGKFNVFCDYYYMLEKSFDETLSYLAMVESRDYKLKNQSLYDSTLQWCKSYLANHIISTFQLKMD